MKMKLLIIAVLSLFFLQSMYSQQNVDSLIKDIRKKYYLIENEIKFDYVLIDEHNSDDDFEMEDEDDIGEIEGTTIYTTKYGYKNGQIMYIEISDNSIQYCTGNSIFDITSKFYYWQGELFFIFSHRYYDYGAIENYKKNIKEERIYVHNGKVIRFLTKEIDLPENFECNDYGCYDEISKVKNVEIEATESLIEYVKQNQYAEH